MSAISVVLCTRNRADRLRRSLETLAPQACTSPWEVLVVDNGSEDGTDQLVRSLATDFPVRLRVHTEAQPGLSYARNAALEVADGDALLFLDDDVSCLPGLLEAHAAMYARAEVVATAGRIVPDLPAEAPSWFRELLANDIGGPTARYDFGAEGCPIGEVGGRRLPHPFGANMGVRRETAIEVRGFRTDLGWGRNMIPSEETDLFLRIQACGGEMHYVPEAAVVHHIEADRVTREYALRWREGYGRALVRVSPSRRGFWVRRKLIRRLRAERRRLDALGRERRERADSLGAIVAELDGAEIHGRLLELTGR